MGRFSDLRDKASERLAKSYETLLEQMFSISDASINDEILNGDQNKLKAVIEGKKLAVETIKLVMTELTTYDENEQYGDGKNDFQAGIAEKFAKGKK